MSGKSWLGVDVVGGPDLTPEGVLLCQDGSAQAPGMSWTSDNKSGWFKSGSTIGTSIGGVQVATQSSSGLTLSGSLTAGNNVTGSLVVASSAVRAAAGSQSQPSLTFGGIASTSSGLWFSTSSGLHTSIGGVSKFAVASDSVSVGPQLIVSAGSSLLPGIGFNTAPGLGFRASDDDEIAISYANDDAFRFSATTGLETFGRGISCGPLAAGDLGANSVDCGVLVAHETVSMTGSCTTGPLSCEALTCSGTLSCGSNSATVGALSTTSVSLGSGGVVAADSGSELAPAITFGESTTGIYRGSSGYTSFASGGSLVARFGSSKMDLYTPLILNGNNLVAGGATIGALSATTLSTSGSAGLGGSLSCSSISTGAVLCGPVNTQTGTASLGGTTVGGTLSCGTNSATVGALSCSSVSSLGAVTQPRYWLRLCRTATQSITNNSATYISWDTQEATGGGSSNWSVSLPATSIAVPVAGTYLVAWAIIFASNSTSYRLGWMELNTVSPGSSRRYGEVQGPAATSQTGFCGSEIIQLTGGDTISIVALQNSGAPLNLLGAGPLQFCTLHIVRLHE